MPIRSLRNIKKEILSLSNTYATSASVAAMPTSAQVAGVYVTSEYCVPRFVTSAYANVTFVKSS